MGIAGRIAELLPPAGLSLVHYTRKFGRLPRLFPPVTFSEHILHRLMFDRDPMLKRICDKIALKDFVSERLGERFAVPLIGAWERSSDIPFDKLPETFVLKPSFTSGPFAIVEPDTDRASLRELAESWLPRRPPHRHYCEWGYKGAPRKVMAEPLLTAPGGGEVAEVNVHVFNDRALLLRVMTGRKKTAARRDAWLDRDGRQLAIATKRIAGARSNLDLETRRELIEVSEAAARGFSSMRVDIYLSADGLRIGELTPYPWGSHVTWADSRLDGMMGTLFAPGADTSIFGDFRG